MVEPITIARPYANALFEHAKIKKIVPEWHVILANIAKIMQTNDMQLFIMHPKTMAIDAVQCLLHLLLEIRVIPKVVSEIELENWLNVLAYNNRLPLSLYIYELFDAMQATQEAKVYVTLTTADILSQDILEHIQEILATKLKKSPQISIVQNAELLGGIIVETGRIVIDGSVRARLKQLKQYMMSL